MSEMVESIPLCGRLRIHLIVLVQNWGGSVAELHERVVKRRASEQRRVDELDGQAF